MPVFRLSERLIFPSPELAEPNGLLAVGGDLSPERLLLAYQHGIFPWYEEGLPILWHSPDPRMVLLVEHRHVPRSLRKAMKREPYELRYDTAFDAVVRACAKTPRAGQKGTWITSDMKRAYSELHRLGWAHSAEAWKDGKLVGGLYGVLLGGVFFGESMFAHADDASKIAFATLLDRFDEWGVTLVDCQVYTEHLARFGAEEWPRKRFLDALHKALRKETRKGSWTAVRPGVT
jgi:leucyl/phenylalanyl-tRNA--protein transferase